MKSATKLIVTKELKSSFCLGFAKMAAMFMLTGEGRKASKGDKHV